MNVPIEVKFPDIERWKRGRVAAPGERALPWVWTYAAPMAGPHVCVTALVHGNEVCGAIAADALLDALESGLRPQRGRLSVVFANVEAYRRFDAARPFASRAVDEDFNRLWDGGTLDGARDSIELRRARELRPFFDGVDHLLDLHSMQEPAPPIALAGDTEKGLALARALAMPEHILVDSGHKAGKRLRDYADFGAAERSRSALLIECGQHWEANVGNVARQATLRFLEHFEVCDHAALQRLGRGLAPVPRSTQRVIDITAVVTVRSAGFRWRRPLRGLEVIAEAGTSIALDGDTDVRTPHADAVMVMPSPEPKVGQTAVRIGRVRAMTAA